MARALKVRGLMNVQFAIEEPHSAAPRIFVLEVNPRASRTAPFVAKTIGQPIASIAAKVMAGVPLKSFGLKDIPYDHIAVKEAVFPFARFAGVDTILGPEMRSTGEVMGADRDLPIAFAKAQMAAGVTLPTEGSVFLSLREGDKRHAADLTRSLQRIGFQVFTTSGTHAELAKQGIETSLVAKISEGVRPNVLDLVRNRQIHLILNTATRKGGNTDEGSIRAQAVRSGIPIVTTVAGARAAVQAMAALKAGPWQVFAIQDYFPHLARPAARATTRETVTV
jgi:carbamoyl-phosphate synthase large subunit